MDRSGYEANAQRRTSLARPVSIRGHFHDRPQLLAVWQALEAAREVDPPRFDPTMLDGLAEVAQRYFARAIAPGTPLPEKSASICIA